MDIFFGLLRDPYQLPGLRIFLKVPLEATCILPLNHPTTAEILERARRQIDAIEGWADSAVHSRKNGRWLYSSGGFTTFCTNQVVQQCQRWKRRVCYILFQTKHCQKNYATGPAPGIKDNLEIPHLTCPIF